MEAIFKGPRRQSGRGWIARRFVVEADLRSAAGHTERGTLRRLKLSSRLPLLGFAAVSALLALKAYFFYRSFGQSPWPIGAEFVEFFIRFWPGRVLLAAQVAVLVYNYFFSITFETSKGTRRIFSAAIRRQFR